VAKVRSPSLEKAGDGPLRWIVGEPRRMWLAAGMLSLIVSIAGALQFAGTLLAPYLERPSPRPGLHGPVVVLERRIRSESHAMMMANAEFRDHTFYSTPSVKRLGGAPGTIPGSNLQAASAPVHTAKIDSADGLPSGPVRRAGVPALLTYQLKPATELASDELSGGASTSLIRALESGAMVNVIFDCSHCDEADRRQAPQLIRMDEGANGVLRSHPLAFHFTPRLTAQGAAGDLRLPPQLSLTFQLDGRDIDRWTIPLEIVGDARHAAGGGVQLTRATFADADAHDGEQPVQLIYHRSPRGGLAIQVIAPLRLRPHFAPLEGDGPGGAGLLGIGRDAVAYLIPVPDTSYENIQEARTDLLGQMDRAFHFAADPSARRPEDADCPVEADATESQTSDAIRTCIGAEAQDLRTHLVPPALEQVLFNLARCQTAEQERGARAPPLVILGGVHYAPIQFLPVNDVRGRPGRCGEGLRVRTAEPGWPASPSDDYLGLLLPIAIAPEEVSNAPTGNRSPRPPRGETRPNIVAGVYEETRPGAPADDAYGFNDFAAYAERELQASVARDAEAFRGRIAELGEGLNLLIINSHGERGEPLRASPDRQTDRIIFSHFEPGVEDAAIPRRARLTGASLSAYFVRRSRETGAIAMPRRPTVLLLACDMAPYRPGSTIPAAFMVGGAHYVIATDSQVPATMARLFGRIVISQLRAGSSPPRAVFEARREIFRTRGSIGPLLWNVVFSRGSAR